MQTTKFLKTFDAISENTFKTGNKLIVNFNKKGDITSAKAAAEQYRASMAAMKESLKLNTEKRN